MIGLENLKIQFEKDKNLFAIIKDERDDRKLWEHAYRVGFFASCLMQRVNLKNKISEEQMFVLGMLHDIGVAALEVLSVEDKILLNQYCFVEHLLQIGRCNYIIVNTIAILLFDAGIEESITRRDNYSIARKLLAR